MASAVSFPWRTPERSRSVAGADPPNLASLRVIERLGMKPIGEIVPDQPGIPYFAISSDAFLDLVEGRE